MKTIGSFEAKTHLSKILDQVARGESFTITKRGLPVASLSPLSSPSAPKPGDSILEFRKKFAKSLGNITVEEIIEFKNFGRR